MSFFQTLIQHRVFTGETFVINGTTNQLDTFSIGYTNLYSPSCWYQNERTFFTSRKHHSVSTGGAMVGMYYNGTVTTKFLTSVGYTPPDDYHSVPVLMLDAAGYIYVFHEPHTYNVNTADVWRSDNPYDIDSFTLYEDAWNVGGYPKIYHNGTKFFGIGRRTTSPTKINPLYAGSSDDGITWGTPYQITEVLDTGGGYDDFRHYPYYCTNGNFNNGWSYLAISKRKSKVSDPTDIVYESQWIFKTQDFVTFYNLGETFSKNVSTGGPLTETELNANFLFNTVNGPQAAAFYTYVDSDAVYAAGAYKTSESARKIFKFSSGVWTEISGTAGLHSIKNKNGFYTINPVVNDLFLYRHGGEFNLTKTQTIYTNTDGYQQGQMPVNNSDIPSGQKFIGVIGTKKNGVTDPVNGTELNDIVCFEMIKQ